ARGRLLVARAIPNLLLHGVQLRLLLFPAIDAERTRALETHGIAVVKGARLLDSLLLRLLIRGRAVLIFELRQTERRLAEDPLLALGIGVGVGSRRNRDRLLRQLHGLVGRWGGARHHQEPAAE